MLEEDKTEKPTNILRVAIDAVIVLETAMLIAMGCVLLTSHGKCDRPVRPWIIVAMCLYAAHISIVLSWRSARKLFPDALKKFVKTLKNICHLIIQLGLLVWVVLGSIWLYSDFADCADDFTGGFVVTLTALLLYYVLAGLSALLLVFWCIGRGLLTKANYEEI